MSNKSRNVWIKCVYDFDVFGMYLTPLIGYSSKGDDKSFWVGWLWWLFTFRLSEDAEKGWVGKLFDFILNLTKIIGKKLPKSTIEENKSEGEMA